MYDLCIFVGEGIMIPTGREIAGTYLDSNEEDIKKQFEKFKEDWPAHGITFMCDSWTGSLGMSIINFMVYCNGVMFFHKSIDSTSHSQDANYVFEVTIILLHHSLVLPPCLMLMWLHVFFVGDRKVIIDLGEEHIMQIVTDNRSNYKKACRLVSECDRTTSEMRGPSSRIRIG
jgi:hypothetical protein